MTYRGHIENGVVVIHDAVVPPDGTQVEVVVIRAQQAEPESHPTIYEALKDVAGKAEGLPPDAAKNVDHYLYGAPKK